MFEAIYVNTCAELTTVSYPYFNYYLPESKLGMVSQVGEDDVAWFMINKKAKMANHLFGQQDDFIINNNLCLINKGNSETLLNKNY